jgi:hypothetical protein
VATRCQAVGQTGSFQVKVRLDYTLWAWALGIPLITTGGQSTAPDTRLLVGDINQDNATNVLDYNLLLNRYSELLPPRGPCSSLQKMAADLKDDGAFNQFDYNLFLRVINNQGGI